MQLQRLTGLEREKILDELAEVQKLIARLREILASEKVLLERDRGRARGGEGALRRRAPHRDPGRGRRHQHRGPDRRGGDGGHRLPRRLRQAEPRSSLYRAQQRGGKGKTGDADPRRGLRREPLRGLDPQLPAGLLRQGEGLLAEGPRDPAGRPRRARQAHREPGAAGRRARRWPPSCRCASFPRRPAPAAPRTRKGRGRARRRAGPPTTFVFTATRRGLVKKTPLDRLLPAARRRHHRRSASRRGTACIAARITDGQEAHPALHRAGHGHPLRGVGRPRHGAQRLRREGHRASTRATRW